MAVRNLFIPSVRGPSLYVCRRQILTYKDGLRAERIKEALNAD